MLRDQGDGEWTWLTSSFLITLFSLQPGQKNGVTRQLRQPGTMYTERPIASCGWHWTAA